MVVRGAVAGACCMVAGACCVVAGTCCMVAGACCVVVGACCMIAVVAWAVVCAVMMRGTVRTNVRVVSVSVARRFAHSVDVVRVVPMAVVPRRRPPVGHKAECCQCGDGEDGCAVSGVAVDRASVGVAVNREAVSIVTRAGPCHAAAVAVG